jgi:uncharacterized membrane protein YoaK (UPF0700 family)
VDPRHRDGLLAVAGLCVLVAIASETGSASRLLDPRVAVVGVAGGLLVEVVFLRYPERALALWDRRGVPVLALAALLAVAVVAVRLAGWLVPVLVWGLLCYLALLACVLAGLGNPVATLVGPREG